MPRAVGNNCASLALNEWQDQSLSGTTPSEDVLALASIYGVGKPLCPVMQRLIRSNRGLIVSAPEKGVCPAGSWMVVPMHSGLQFHVIRQVPERGGRFLQIAGPDEPLEWFRVGDRVATRFEQVRSLPDYTVCSPLCVRDTVPPLPEPKDESKVPVRTVRVDAGRLAGTWLAVEPAAEADVPWRGYRSPRCDAYLNRMELHLGSNAAHFLSTAAPPGVRPETLAALSIVSNVLEPEKSRAVGVNIVWAGRLAADVGRIEFTDLAYFGAGAEAAVQSGSTISGTFYPWIVQPRAGGRVSITAFGENSLRATIDWDSSCSRELLFVRPQVAYSGAAPR